MRRDNFVATDGWFQRWKKRENIVYGKAFGEQLDVNIEGAEMWPKTQWPALIAQYSPDDIFNADETGLYFRALPELIYFTRNEKAKCCKTNKERLTILASTRWFILHRRINQKRLNTGEECVIRIREQITRKSVEPIDIFIAFIKEMFY